MQNVIILHQYHTSCDFGLLMNKEVKDLLKTQSMTWYLHFLMTQYVNQRWVKHFQMTRKVVFAIDKKTQTFNGKKTQNIYVQFR